MSMADEGSLESAREYEMSTYFTTSRSRSRANAEGDEMLMASPLCP